MARRFLGGVGHNVATADCRAAGCHAASRRTVNVFPETHSLGGCAPRHTRFSPRGLAWRGRPMALQERLTLRLPVPVAVAPSARPSPRPRRSRARRRPSAGAGSAFTLCSVKAETMNAMAIGQSNLKWELKRLALFATFDEDDLEYLTQAGSSRVFKAREMIFHEGDKGGSMHVVLSGRVKVSAFSADGREVVLSFAGPGEVLGEITLLDGGPRTASA